MGFFERILVPVDGSRPSEVGAALALQFAKEFGGKLTFVNIVDLERLSTTSDFSLDVSSIFKDAVDAGTQLANQAAEEARAAGVPADAIVREGPVLEMLLEAIAHSGATIVVMGSHGRGLFAQALMGSTTDGLLRKSPVPVVVAPRGTPRNV